MTRKSKTSRSLKARTAAVAEAVTRTARRVRAEVEKAITQISARATAAAPDRGPVEKKASSPQRGRARAARPASPRPVKRASDVNEETLEGAVPSHQSSKGSMADRSARSRDDEISLVLEDDEQFRDEDHFTNRSGDPRIGTHRGKGSLEPS